MNWMSCSRMYCPLRSSVRLNLELTSIIKILHILYTFSIISKSCYWLWLWQSLDCDDLRMISEVRESLYGWMRCKESLVTSPISHPAVLQRDLYFSVRLSRRSEGWRLKYATNQYTGRQARPYNRGVNVNISSECLPGG